MRHTVITDEELCRIYLNRPTGTPVHVNKLHVEGLRRVFDATFSAIVGGEK